MKANRIASCIGGFLALGLLLASGLASAQDWTGMQGGAQRLGRNSDATLESAGRGLLTWYTPLRTDEFGRTLVRNNTSTAAAALGNWVAPALIDEAFGAYTPVPAVPTTDPINVAENLLRGLDPITSEIPGYLYSTTIPSAPNNNLARNFAADTLSTFTWTVEPPTGAFANQRIARTYALYTWLPAGPTTIGGNLVFPSRFWVYEIIYNGTQRYVDIVDTFAAGTGWVRLGGGGLPTDRVFAYNGTDPIQIRLYNTLPRRPGRENDVVNPGHNWLNTYFDVPYNSLVYADAVRAEPVNGTFNASPLVTASDPGNGASSIYAFATRNNFSVGQVNGQDVTVSRGEVTAHNHQTGNAVWRWSPLDESPYTTTLDNSSAGVTSAAPWAVPGVLTPPFQGVNYLSAPITNDPLAAQSVLYSPTLQDGSYEVLAFIPGSRAPEFLGRDVEVRIEEGATVTTVIVDQDAARGWVRLGSRRFNHSQANRLRVRITNYSANVADAGRQAFADSVRFIGAVNLSINSTPYVVNAQVRRTNGGAPTAGGVTLIAAEDGRIYCIDSEGNGDGTTNVYWAYPSLPDPNVSGWTDPNHVVGEDGPNGISIDPNGFDLSSALVQNVGGTDYLYIASRNGRIYCLEMAGRGDMNLGRRQPGTTRRVWTYPDDYPSQAQTSLLGPFRGSLTFAVTASGPTIFAPAAQGRLYALPALPAVPATKTVVPRWTFPVRTAPTLGPIRMTPLAANGRVFFGTEVKLGEDRGRFYALNWNDGSVLWQFNTAAAWGGAVADDFIAGPAHAEPNQLGPGSAEAVFVANENRWISSLDAATGAVLWTSNELLSGVASNLSLARMNVFNGTGGGARALSSLLMVPTTDGRFTGLFALPGTGFGSTNIFGTKRAWEYSALGSPLIAGISTGRAFTYGADTAGFFYAFNDLGNGSGEDIDGPGQRSIVENDDSDPNVAAFRDAKIVFVNRATYSLLRQASGAASLPTYAEALAAANIVTRQAFDWGEIVYGLVYDFPYQDTYLNGPLAGQPAPPPVANFQFSVEGNSIRNLSVESRRFRGNTNPLGREGYAVIAFVLQGGGGNAMPPGSARVSFALSTTALQSPPRPVNIQPNPAAATRIFNIANPLGLIMNRTVAQIGNNPDPSAEENLFNGSLNVSTTPRDESRLVAEAGLIAHGNTQSVTIGVVDRSLMVLLRGNNQGLDGVRFDRGDLAWQGGKGAVVRPIDAIPFYAAFWASGRGLEDYPLEFPNNSLDYSDIPRERLRVVKDPNGVAENPVFNGISLFPVTNVNEAAPIFPTRTLNATPFELSLEVPRFQPANATVVTNSEGGTVPGGYFGGMSVFVDSNNDGVLTRDSGRREAFRNFFFGAGVLPDDRLSVATESIDFGSLAHSSGYDPLAPTSGGTFSPWAGSFTELFKPMVIRNEGNVNLGNIRLAKAYNNGGINVWEVFSPTNNALGFLNGTANLHATFDEQFALTPSPILPKARPTDLNPTQFRDNPRVRPNPNIGALGGPLLAGSPDPDLPRVAVTTPLGFPVGVYEWILRVIDDRIGDETDPVDNTGASLLPSDDFGVRFVSRESRITGSPSTRTAPMIDNLVSGNEAFLHDNQQPAALRTPTGDLATIFVSNRFSAPAGSGFDKTPPLAFLSNPQWRLYFAGVDGTTPTGSATPLTDLNAFTPNAGRWFNRSVAEFPTTPAATLFPGDPVVAGTDQYGAPAVSSTGLVDVFNGGTLPFAYVAFLGNVQKQGASERYEQSRLFLTRMTVAGDGAITLTDPVGLEVDPLNRKGKPALFQTGSNATLFYTSGGTGQSQIHWVFYNGTNANPAVNVLDTSAAFDAVGNPSVIGRVYQGVQTTGTAANNARILEVAFQGRLRGRSQTDIYWLRMNADANGRPTGLVFFPEVTNERLVVDPNEPTVFRTRGVNWNSNGTIRLQFQPTAGAVPQDIEVANTRQFDPTTGILSFDTRLGGRAFLNLRSGSVRLSSAIPNRGGGLVLTYQPRFLRVSETAGAHATPQLMFDNRLTGEFEYWRADDNAPITPDPSNEIRPSRFLFSYARSPQGNQVGRPFLTTYRAGIQLPAAIHTQPNGQITSVLVNGLNSSYQVDAANGRIYVTDADENAALTVQATLADPTTGAPFAFSVQTRTSLIAERTEAPITVEQAVNESQPWLFLDPFDTSGHASQRRPGLIWMFWTSTRAGASDVFFQTLAPRFAPTPRP